MQGRSQCICCLLALYVTPANNEGEWYLSIYPIEEINTFRIGSSNVELEFSNRLADRKKTFVWLIFCFDTSVLFTRRTFKICICDHHDQRTLGHYELLNYDIRWGSWCCAREDWLERYISICWKRTFFRIYLTWLISRTNCDISFVIDGTIHLRKTTVNAVELLLSILMFCSFVPC